MDLTDSPSSPKGADGSWVRLALARRTRRRTLGIALVVGTLVSLINQAGPVSSGTATLGTWMRVASNYLLPLAVSTFASVSTMRSGARTREER